MSVTVVQRNAVDPEEYGVPGNVRDAASSVQEGVQSKADGQPARQQAMHQMLRSGKDLTKYDAQGKERKSVAPANTAAHCAPKGSAAVQPSTLGRVQTAMARQGNAPDARAGNAAVAASASVGAGVSPASNAAQKFIDRYDGGSGKPSLNYSNDQRAARQLAQYSDLSLTGLPPSTVKDDQAIVGLTAQLAQMDESTRESYSARAMKALQQPPAQRSAAIAALKADVSKELSNIEQDPVRRLAAMFNAPVGVQYLQDGGRAQMRALRQHYEAFVAPGASDATRAQALKSAVQLKKQMQTDIQKAVTTQTASEQQAWTASTQRVERILNEAEHYTAQNIRLPTYTDDPQWNDKRAEAYAQTYGYQSIGEKLLSDDGLSQQERDNPGYWHAPGMQRSANEKARDLLIFQQGLNDPNSIIFKRVHALESGAVHELTANGDKGHYLDQVGTPKLYWDIGQALPQADGKYVQNLAQKYIDTTKDLDQKSRQMMREHTPDTLDKVLYATGKVLNSLMPLPGMDWLAGQLLDAAIPNHGGLSSGEEAVLDTTLMIGGLLMGGLDKLPMLKGKFGLGEASEMELGKLHPVEANVEPSLPMSAKERIARSLGALPDPTAPKAPQQPNSPSGEAGSVQKTGAAGSEQASAPRAEGLPVPSSYEESRPSGELDWRNNVFVDKQGGRHIEKDGHWYKVKYDADNGTLRVIHPHDASKPTYPVRIAADGTFEVHGDVGLKGGGPKPTPELTPEQKREILRRLDGWQTQRQVADAMGLSPERVRQVAHEEAMRVRDEIRQIPDDTLHGIMEGLRRGLSVDDVAAGTKTSYATVRSVAQEYGIALAIDRRVPIETRQAAADMLSAGRSMAEVHSRFKLKYNVVRAIAHEYNLVVPVRRGAIPPKTSEEAIDLLKEGMKPAAVARKLGVAKATVYRIARDNGIALPSVSGIALDVRQQVIDRMNQARAQKTMGEQREIKENISKDLGISSSAVDRIYGEYRLEEGALDAFAEADPAMLDALEGT
ncbi:helix-turn-helix domain-containing protein [Paraburkholderia fungorum]|uniref:helix-turn-helix domain-containing protein n=1 Tax=Paraburkholderia fungorum TaxID=134537 RepID=UPI0038B9B699